MYISLIITDLGLKTCFLDGKRLCENKVVF